LRYKKIIGTLVLALSINVLSPSLLKKAHAEVKPPNIQGKFAITMDLKTGEIIYTKAPDSKAYPASTTKLLTAILLAENKSKEDALKFTPDALKQPDYAIYRSFGPIPLGTTISASDAMKGLMLFSGNDIAYVIADNVAGSNAKFSEMMNSKLKEWNLKDTHFVNPNGLPDANHYTTPYELAIITKKAYENPWVKEAMNTKNATIKTSNNLIINVENRNKNVGVDGCVAGKTGYTKDAGRCLATVYERDGRTLIGIVMNSVYDLNDTAVFEDMKKVIDYSYAAEKTSFMKADTTVGTYPIKYKLFKFFGPEKTIDVPFILTEDVNIYDNEINKNETKGIVEIKETDGWNLAKNPKASIFKVSQRAASHEYAVKANITTQDLLKQNMVIYGITLAAIIFILVLIILIIRIFSKRSRRRGRRRY